MKKLCKPGNVTDCMVGYEKYEKVPYKKGFVFRVFQASTRPAWVSVEGHTAHLAHSCACLCSPEKREKKKHTPENPLNTTESHFLLLPCK